MAIRTFNSVGGFSVGEIPTNVIDPNGVGSFTSIKTDNLLRADGNVWDLQQAAGSTGWIQFNTDNNFAATANLTFITSSNYAASLDILTVNGNLAANNLSILSNISAANISSANITGNMSGNFSGNMSGNFSGNITGGATISAPGSDTQLIFNDGNTIEAAPGLKYIKGANVTVSRVEVVAGLLVGATANIVGATVLGSTLAVTGVSTLASAIVTGSTTVGTTLDVTGAANLASTLNVTGATTLTSTLAVTAATTLSSTLGVTGVATLANATVTTDASVGNTLTTKDLAITGVIFGDLIPNGHYTQNLGNASHAWKDLWLSGSTINLGTQTLTSNSTGTTLSNVTSMTTIVVTGANTTNDAITGALVVAGGVGIGGNIYVSGKANIEGDVLIGKDGPGNAASANVTGNLQVGGSATVTGNITISGDLTVGGNTTYVNTTNTSIKDAIIDLGGAGSGANLAGSAVGDRGLLLHGSSAVNQFMGWNTGDSEFQLYTDAVVAAGVVTGNLSTLRVDTLYGTVKTDSQPNIGNMSGLFDIAVSNLADIATGNITTSYIGTLTASGLLYPTADGAAPATNEVTVLSTDGDATLGFSTIHTDRIANATSSVVMNASGSTNVNFNVNLLFTVIETGANVTGVLKSTTSVDTPTVNATTVLVTPKITIGSTAIYSATATSTSTSPTVVATVSKSSCRAIDFLVKGESTGKYTVATITAIHDGTDVDYAVHSKLHFGDIGAAGSFSVVMDGANINLVATATISDSTSWVTQIRTI